MKNIQKQVGILENQLITIFEKVPHIPKEIRDILITLAPWCALIIGVLGILSLFAAGILSLFLTVATFGLAFWLLIPITLGLISSIFALWAYPGLNNGLKSGWDKLFWSQLISIIGMVLSVFGDKFSIGTLIGSVIGLYLLFEIRSHYK